MSRRKVSAFMYTSLASSCVRDLEQAAEDGETTLAGLQVDGPTASETMAGEHELALRSLKKRMRAIASSIRAMNAELDAAIAAVKPPKKKADDKQLPLPHVAP